MIGDGKLVPHVFAEEFALEGEQFARAAVEVGEVGLAVETDDSVGGRFEDTVQLARGGVAEKFGSLAVRDVAEGDG